MNHHALYQGHECKSNNENDNENLNGIQPSLMLLIAPVLFLTLPVKMSFVKKGLFDMSQ